MKKNTDNDFICQRLIACDPLVGRPGMPLHEHDTDVRDLAGEMQRLNIAGAVVRNHDCLRAAPYFGNDMLMRSVAGHPDLRPAWFLTPDGCAPDFNVTKLIKIMLHRQIKVAWTSSLVGNYAPECSSRISLRAWCCREMMDALQQHRIPLLISFESIDLPDLHEVMQDFPKLRIILLDIPRLGRQAMLEALLKMHPGLHLCFSPSFSVHGGYRDLCSRYGDHRWVWGMGYPQSEGGAAITGLVYSGLTSKQMEAVAFKNIERLLAEVKK